MIADMIQQVPVLECPQGHGTWVNEDDLREAKDETEPDLTWLDFEIWQHEERFHVRPNGLLCPVDQVLMVTLEYEQTGVEIDYCTKCKGVWLDQGEFEEIIDALDEEILTKDMPDYIKASLHEARELVTGPEPRLSEWRDLMTVLRLFQYRALVEKPALKKALEVVQRTGLGLSGYFPP
jgi:Zn-finger nucleic acid-binding protein